MSYFEVKMHKISISVGGSTPDPTRGAHSAPSDPLAGFEVKGSYFYEKGRKRKGKEEGMKGRGEGVGARTPSIKNFWLRHCK